MKLPSCLLVVAVFFIAVVSASELEDMPANYQKLVSAILAGDLDGMKAAVAEGASINAREESGTTPLAHAIDAHQNTAFRWLLKNGADIGFQERPPHAIFYSVTSYPLSLAIRAQNWEACEELLRAGAKPHIEQLANTAVSPAGLAVEYGNASILKKLEEAGIDWKKPIAGDSPLQLAISHNNTEAAEFLLDGRASATEPLTNGNQPLADAAVFGNPTIVKALLAKGADPNVINQEPPVIRYAGPFPHTALVNAVRRNSLEIVEMLLQAGADPKALDNAAIKWADLLGNDAIFRLLLKSGAEKPSPHAFLSLPQFKQDGEPPVLTDTTFSDWDFLAAVNAAPATAPTAGQSTLSFAVVSLSDQLADASSLVTAAFSKLPQVTLVERDDLRTLGKERSPGEGFNPLTLAREGVLVGADVVVFLSEQGDSVELRAVDASSGLVIFSTLVPKKKITPDLMDRLASSTLHASSKLGGELSKQLLVSLPILTSSRSTPEVDRLTRQLSAALAMFLGTQPGIYVLDRSEMQRLSLEKDLNADLSAFVASGLLIDGGLELSPDRNDEVTLSLRARTIDGRERAVIQTKGTLQHPQKLLNDAGNALLAGLGKPEGIELDRGAEAAAYAKQARSAYDLQLWPQSHALAQAAAALGFSDPDFLKFRIVTICRLLRSDLQVISEAISSAREKEEEREILARCMPLDFLSDAVTPRSPADYLDLAEELLDLVSPIVYLPNRPSSEEQRLWEYLPTIFAAATLPLELTVTLSDREKHAAGFESLRSKLLAQSATAIARSKEWQLYSTYRELVQQRCRLLCFWVDDENQVISEMLRIIAEAHKLEEPDILHFLMSGATPGDYGTPRRIGSRLGTFPERLAKAMAASDLPHARLKGILLLTEWVIGPTARKNWEEQLPQAYEQALVFDHTPAGIGHTRRLEENPPTLKSGRPDGRRLETFITPWYPEPRYSSKKLRTDLTTRRLEYLAEYGLGTSLLFAKPSELDAATLSRWLELCETALAKFEASPDKELFPSAAGDFREFRIAPIKSALAVLEAANAPKPSPQASVTGILPAQIPELVRGKESMLRGGINVIYQNDVQDEIWVSIEEGGFVKLSQETRVLEAIPFPKGHSSGWLRANGQRFLAAELGIDDSSDDVFAIYDRKTKIWKFYPDAIRARALITGDTIIVGMLHHPDPKTNSNLEQDERTTFTLEEIDPGKDNRTILVSSRRTPALSPVDNKPELARGRGASALSERELVFFDFAFHLDTREWRPLTKEDRVLMQSRSRWVSPIAPWRGRLYDINFQKETGYLVIKADISEPAVTSSGKSTTKSRKYEIPIPPVEIRVAEGAMRKEEAQKLLALDGFRYKITPKGPMLAWNDQILVVIPESVYIPSVHRWLETNQIPQVPSR